MSIHKTNSITDLLEFEIDAIYELIGNDINGKKMFPISKEKMILDAKKWYNNSKKNLTSIVCNNKTIRDYLSNKNILTDRVALVSAVADLISSLTIGISPITVSVLIVKEGLNVFCKDCYKEN